MGCRQSCGQSGVGAFDFTVDDSDRTNNGDEVVDTVPASSVAPREAGLHVMRATSHHAEDEHDQLSIEEGGHSTVFANPHLIESMSTPIAVLNRFAP